MSPVSLPNIRFPENHLIHVRVCVFMLGGGGDRKEKRCSVVGIRYIAYLWPLWLPRSNEWLAHTCSIWFTEIWALYFCIIIKIKTRKYPPPPQKKKKRTHTKKENVIYSRQHVWCYKLELKCTVFLESLLQYLPSSKIVNNTDLSTELIAQSWGSAMNDDTSPNYPG